MTGTAGSAALTLVTPAPAGGGEMFGHVLSGVVLAGDAARLAAVLDREFLAEAGWDPSGRVLSRKAGSSVMSCKIGRISGADHFMFTPVSCPGNLPCKFLG